MLKVAVIFENDPYDHKGLFNAVHNRVRHLSSMEGILVDVFCVSCYDNCFVRLLRRYVKHDIKEKRDKKSYIEHDGIKYNLLWYDFSLTDMVLMDHIGQRPLFFRRFMAENVNVLSGYDHVMAHSFTGALFAYEANKKYGVPYSVTWHGSDIHTHPYRWDVVKSDTAKVMSSARMNFFVSRALMNESERLYENHEEWEKLNKKVIYNGVSNTFRKLTDEELCRAKERFCCPEGCKVVIFVGMLVAVKNVRSLPAIFSAISAAYEGNLMFLVAGDGKMRDMCEPQIKALQTDEGASPFRICRFLGNVPVSEMPELMNCADVMIIPSLNEGLPLVTIEAYRCGVSVIGSRVGGIPEVIGLDNTVALPSGPDDESRFVKEFAEKAVEALENPKECGINPLFDWEKIAQTEADYLKAESFR